MPIIKITDLNHPGVEVFSRLTESQLRNRLCPEQAMFIAESPKVIRVAMASGYSPVAILCEQKHIEGDAADIIAACPDIPVYTGSRDLLASITGYQLTRGVLCAMHRPADKSAQDVCKGAKRVVVIDGVVDTTNIGSIFRAAAALGIDAVLLTTTSCDPFNRRSIRVSMGTVFVIPWAWINNPSELKVLGFTTVAMALRDDSVSLDDPALNRFERLAIIMGTEGDGLADKVIEDADYTVRIPMSRNVDSLNVASAAAVAFWQLRAR